MRCRHTTCADRRTEDFVAAMIEQGELDRDDVFSNADYRDAYEEERPAVAPVPLTSTTRNLIKK